MPFDQRHVRQQRGVTTLISVMVLFFIMALVAAYANRNLILEQRTALNFQRIGAAHQINHHAVAHLLGLFNAGKVDSACRLNAAGATRCVSATWCWTSKAESMSLLHREAFTQLSTPPRPSRSPAIGSEVKTGACQCPTDYAPAFVPEDGQPRESYIARARHYALEAAINPAENISRFGISVMACMSSSASCVQARTTPSDVAISTRTQSLTLVRALKMPPVSAVVARGSVDLSSGMVAAHNEPAFGGVAIQAGEAVIGNRSRVTGPAGSPANSSVVANETSLLTADADLFFRRFFGVRMADYVAQPASQALQCDGGCATRLQDLVNAGGQLIHRAGDLVLSEEVTVGTVTRPVVLVVDGALTINGPVRIVGLVYSKQALNWSNGSASPSVIQGAVLTAGDLVADKGAAALFDGTVLARLKLQAGSFVPLPGGTVWDTPW